MKRFHVTHREDYGVVMLGYLTAQLKDQEIQLTNRQRLQLINALRNAGGALAVELVPKLEKMRGPIITESGKANGRAN